MSGQDLVQMLSVRRVDGKEVVSATVSRWLSGTSPVDPAVLGWMEELVKAKAKSSIRPSVKMPEGGSLCICVASPKGGSGDTTLAQALAIIAKADFGLSVLHLKIGRGAEDDLVQERLKSLCIDSRILSVDEADYFSPEPGQVVIADVGREEIDRVRGGGSNAGTIFSSETPDVILIPISFESSMAVSTLEPFLGDFEARCPVKVLHRPRWGELAAIGVARKYGFDMESELFMDFFLLQAPSEDFMPHTIYGKWSDTYQHQIHSRLFVKLVEIAGGKVYQEEFEACMMSSNFETLLASLETVSGSL